MGARWYLHRSGGGCVRKGTHWQEAALVGAVCVPVCVCVCVCVCVHMCACVNPPGDAPRDPESGYGGVCGQGGTCQRVVGAGRGTVCLYVVCVCVGGAPHQTIPPPHPHVHTCSSTHSCDSALAVLASAVLQLQNTHTYTQSHTHTHTHLSAGGASMRRAAATSAVNTPPSWGAVSPSGQPPLTTPPCACAQPSAWATTASVVLLPPACRRTAAAPLSYRRQKPTTGTWAAANSGTQPTTPSSPARTTRAPSTSALHVSFR